MLELLLAAGGLIIALVGSLFWQGKQRKATEAKLRDIEKNVDSIQQTRVVEQQAADAAAAAREDAQETTNEHEARPSSTRPDGSFRR